MSNRMDKDTLRHLEKIGIRVYWWALGDGVTRYRFSSRRGDYDYFSCYPMYPTCYGRKEAELYAKGLLNGYYLCEDEHVAAETIA